MNVYLYDVLIIDNNNAVSDGLQIFSKVRRLFLEIGDVYDKLGAVAEGYLLCLIVLNGEGHLAVGDYLRLVYNGSGFALKGTEHLLKDDNETLSACVNNACFFKYGELLGSFFQSVPCGSAHVRPLYQRVVCDKGGFPCLFCADSCNGEDSAFCGLHNSLVSCVNAYFKGVCHIIAVSFLFICTTL